MACGIEAYRGRHYEPHLDFSASKKACRVSVTFFRPALVKASLLVTSPGLWNHYDDPHPAAIYLFDRLLRYASSDSFAPKIAISDDLLQQLQTE